MISRRKKYWISMCLYFVQTYSADLSFIVLQAASSAAYINNEEAWLDYGTLFRNDAMPTINLTAEDFKENIFDYSGEQEWKYKGNLPAIIDFYADWCGPCKSVAPVLEELSNEYNEKLLIYKIDTDK